MEPTYLVFLLCSIFVGATKEPGGVTSTTQGSATPPSNFLRS
eukprot:06278.XXX_339250_319132_1 [CDS] Oithona nana genome sequencing.